MGAEADSLRRAIRDVAVAWNEPGSGAGSEGLLDRA